MEETKALEPEYQDDDRPEVRGQWQIANLTDADWALKRIAECQAELREIEIMEAAALRQVEERVAKLTNRARAGIAYFEARLGHWATEHRSELLAGKAKSKNLIAGRIGWRGHPERLEVVDPDALTGWLKGPDGAFFVRPVEPKPDMKAIQAAFAENGTIPPGCSVRPAGDEFYADPEPIESALTKKE